jgi:predicted phage terminase large subunit-like protein
MPFPKQEAFLWLQCLEAFYGGQAGGGKSDALLMGALQYVDIPGYNALLIRDTFANLNKPGSLMDRASEWLAGTDAKWVDKCWVFPSSASLSFGYLDSPKDHYQYQGAEYQYIGFDEVVNIREHQALYLFSRLRRKTADAYKEDLKNLPKFVKLTTTEIEKYYQEYKQIPLRFRAASNPPTGEQAARGKWVKKRYVDQRTRQKGTIFIPSGLGDNPFLDREEYLKSLENLDPITRAQLVDGNWDIQATGGMFKREWWKFCDADKVPKDCKFIRYWDLAATEPHKENKEPAYTAGVKIGKSNEGQYYITSVIRFRKSPRDVEAIVRQTADMDGKETAILMEQEPGSSGVNTIDHYRRRVLPEFIFKGDKVSGSKYQRAQPFSSQVEAGNVFLVTAQWNEDFLEEADLFPNGAFKDQVDSAGGGFAKLFEGNLRIRRI